MKLESSMLNSIQWDGLQNWKGFKDNETMGQVKVKQNESRESNCRWHHKNGYLNEYLFEHLLLSIIKTFRKCTENGISIDDETMVLVACQKNNWIGP